MGVATTYNPGDMAKPSTYVAVSPAQRAGSLAEAQALDYLRSQGLRPVAANVRLRCGEIDLIMADGDQCVFVEVRRRSSARYGGAAASVTRARMAAHALRCRRLRRRSAHLGARCVLAFRRAWIARAWIVPGPTGHGRLPGTG